MFVILFIGYFRFIFLLQNFWLEVYILPFWSVWPFTEIYLTFHRCTAGNGARHNAETSEIFTEANEGDQHSCGDRLLLVDDCLMVALKAVDILQRSSNAQLLTWMK